MKNLGYVEKLLMKDIPKKCSQCGNTRLYYKGLGSYECKKCQNIEYDDYGKIRNYIDKYGNTPVQTLVLELGIDKEIVEYYIKDGKLEIVEDESINLLTCYKCGCTIITGRYCTACQKELTDGIKDLFKEKKNISGHSGLQKNDSGAKMRYLDK